MVIKIHKSIAVHASLKYVIGKLDNVNNKIIMTGNLPDSDSPLATIREEFRKRDIANIRSERVSFHASINPTTQDLEKIDIQDLCKEYMTRMGYGSQPYIVVEHNDTGRKHYHIVSHRIMPNGKKINSSNEVIKTNRFVKEINKRISQPKKVKQPKENIIATFNPEKGSKKQQILDIWTAACSYSYANNHELNAILQSYGLEMIVKDGKVYAAGTKQGKRITRAIELDNHMINPTSVKKLSKRDTDRLNNLVRFAMKVSLNEQQAKNILSRKDIGLVLLKNDEGRIYGVYIVDHKNKVVLKGSDISKEIAANQWDDLHNTQWDKIKMTDKSSERKYSCLNLIYAGDYMYNYWENADLSYKDLKYTRRREMGRKR